MMKTRRGGDKVRMVSGLVWKCKPCGQERPLWKCSIWPKTKTWRGWVSYESPVSSSHCVSHSHRAARDCVLDTGARLFKVCLNHNSSTYCRSCHESESQSTQCSFTTSEDEHKITKMKHTVHCLAHSKNRYTYLKKNDRKKHQKQHYKIQIGKSNLKLTSRKGISST